MGVSFLTKMTSNVPCIIYFWDVVADLCCVRPQSLINGQWRTLSKNKQKKKKKKKHTHVHTPLNYKFWSINWHYVVHKPQKKVCNSVVSRFHYFHFNHICHFLDPSYLIKIVVSLPVLSLYWSSKGVHQKEKRSVITDQIPSVQAKLHWIFAWVRFEPLLYNVDVFRKWTFCTLKSRFNT